MVFKTLKPGKDVEKGETQTTKKRGSSDKKPQARQTIDSEPHSSLGVFSYFGKHSHDPQVSLKLLQLTPRNPGQEASKGLQEFIKQMTKIISEKKKSFKDGNVERERLGNDEGISNRNFENVQNEILEKNPHDKGNALNKRGEYLNKMKRSRTESPGKKKEKVEAGAPERKQLHESPKEKSERYSSSEEKCPKILKGVKTPKTPKRPKTPKNQPIVEQVKRKKLKRSEIPLLKNRRNLEKQTEVSLLLQKSLVENDSSTSIDLYQNKSLRMNPTPELEIVLKANGSSSKLVGIGEVNQLKDSKIQQLEAPEKNHLDRCMKNPNIPEASKTSDAVSENKKTPKRNKTKALDMEKVKTSSFTVLRGEVDSFTRLETFHHQNVTAKDNARAGIALKVSKLRILTSKTSLTSIKSSRNSSSSLGSRRSKASSKKYKKNKTDRSEPKNTLKTSETSHLEIYREMMATGKVGCLIPKRMEKDTKDLKIEGKTLSLSPVGTPKSTPTKTTRKAEEETRSKSKENLKKEPPKVCPKNDGKFFKKNKIRKQQRLREQKQQVSSENSTVKCSGVKISSECVTKRQENGNCQNSAAEEIPDEIKLTAKEMASLIIKGTALHCDPHVEDIDKMRLEVKIDVQSEEDISGSDLLDCESFGDVSGTSFDWLIKSTNHDEKTKHFRTKEKPTSYDFADEIKAKCDWQVSDSVLQGTHHSVSVKKNASVKTSANGMEKKTKSETGEWRSLSGGAFNCPLYIQNDNKPDTKVRSGLTRSSNRDEKIFEDPAGLKLRRRNSEPYSFRGFIWKRADLSFSKSLKASVSSVPSSLRHLNTDEMDDFIFWEAVPQKLTSCWEMSLYHFKRPWSVLSCSVFKDNRRANTPGVILDSLRSGGLHNLRPPFLHQSDRLNRRKGNIFDVEPSISQKNIDIRNWLAALNFTSCISNSNDVISEGTFSTPSMITPQKQQANPKRRNVIPELRLAEKEPEKKVFHREQLQRLDKWNINDIDELKELVRRESGSYVTKEQYISELSNPRLSIITKPCTHSSSYEAKSVFGENGDQKAKSESKKIKSVETSCQSDAPQQEVIAQHKSAIELSESSGSQRPLLGETDRREATPPLEVNIWKYLFLFTLFFIVFQYSLGSTLSTLGSRS